MRAGIRIALEFTSDSGEPVCRSRFGRDHHLSGVCPRPIDQGDRTPFRSGAPGPVCGSRVPRSAIAGMAFRPAAPTSSGESAECGCCLLPAVRPTCLPDPRPPERRRDACRPSGSPLASGAWSSAGDLSRPDLLRCNAFRVSGRGKEDGGSKPCACVRGVRSSGVSRRRRSHMMRRGGRTARAMADSCTMRATGLLCEG